jgi:hypothetical protein
VPNVMRFLFGHVIDIGKQCGQIIVSHMLESKLPKLFILIRIVLGVVSGMFVTPAVSQPNIVAFIGEKKTWCFVLIVDDPGI